MVSKFHTILAVILLTTSLGQPPIPNGRGGRTLKPFNPRFARNSNCRSVVCRTFDGACTSASDPMWGRARLPQFSYVFNSSSKVPTGAGLRSAREISNIIFDQPGSIPNSRGLNQLFVFFGQFLDHNFATTPTNPKERFDIAVPGQDPFIHRDSLPFRRSVRAQTAKGAVRPINTLTSAVDLDAVYGPNLQRNRELQEFQDGSLTGNLRVSPGNLLPLNIRSFVNLPDNSSDFFLAGDHRANEHPALTAIHTIFVREHNYLAEKIRRRLPGLPTRDVFENARKLNIAQFQKIVFEEFYPAIVGSRLPAYRGFRRDTDPTISDVFVGAAFRVGHTMVDNNIPRRNANGPISPIPASEIFFRKANTFTVQEFEDVTRGIANTVAQEVDARVVDVLRNALFANTGLDEGPDLIALNIQRSRDHALPKFNEIRRIFGLPKLRSISQISTDPENVDRLSRAYNNVDEVEAFPGLLAENPVPGSSFGPTMRAVWQTEFTRMRDGDQFFYLNIRKSIPRQIQRPLRDCIRDLIDNSKSLFREIILRNTNIFSRDLPSGDVFTL